MIAFLYYIFYNTITLKIPICKVIKFLSWINDIGINSTVKEKQKNLEEITLELFKQILGRVGLNVIIIAV